MPTGIFSAVNQNPIRACRRGASAEGAKAANKTTIDDNLYEWRGKKEALGVKI